MYISTSSDKVKYLFLRDGENRDTKNTYLHHSALRQSNVRWGVLDFIQDLNFRFGIESKMQL